MTLSGKAACLNRGCEDGVLKTKGIFIHSPKPFHLYLMIPLSLSFNQRADIRARLTSHSIRARKQEKNKKRSRKPSSSPRVGRAPGNVGRTRLWGRRNAGLPIFFPKHSLLQQTKYFHMLLLEHPGSWSNRGAASRDGFALSGRWSSLQPGLGPTAWHGESRCTFPSFIQCFSGFHLFFCVVLFFFSFFFPPFPCSIFTLYCSVTIDFTPLFSGFCCPQGIW